MNNPTTAITAYLRTAGGHSAEWNAEQDRRQVARREALEARQAAFRAKNPELAAAIEADMRRR